jgi:hypothetical protein
VEHLDIGALQRGLEDRLSIADVPVGLWIFHAGGLEIVARDEVAALGILAADALRQGSPRVRVAVRREIGEGPHVVLRVAGGAQLDVPDGLFDVEVAVRRPVHRRAGEEDVDSDGRVDVGDHAGQQVVPRGRGERLFTPAGGGGQIAVPFEGIGAVRDHHLIGERALHGITEDRDALGRVEEACLEEGLADGAALGIFLVDDRLVRGVDQLQHVCVIDVRLQPVVAARAGLHHSRAQPRLVARRKVAFSRVGTAERREDEDERRYACASNDLHGCSSGGRAGPAVAAGPASLAARPRSSARANRKRTVCGHLERDLLVHRRRGQARS